MKIKEICLLVLVAVFGLASCDDVSKQRLVGGADAQESGTAKLELSLRLGAQTYLARMAMSDPLVKQLQLEFTAGNPLSSDYLIRRDTIWIDSDIPVLNFELEVGNKWYVYVSACDSTGNVLYAGGEYFELTMGIPKRVDLMLKDWMPEFRVEIPVFSKMTSFQLRIGDDVIDSVLPQTAKAGDTLVLIHSIQQRDLPRDITAVLKLFGDYWGRDTLLFQGETRLELRPNAPKSGPMLLRWVGPMGSPNGVVNVGITLISDTVGIGMSYPGYGYSGRGRAGDFWDRQSGQTYKYKRFGNQIWMLKNIGSTCEGCDSGGRQYEKLEYARNACPYGWHLPNQEEWTELIRFAAAGEHDSIGLRHLFSTTGWRRMEGWDQTEPLPPAYSEQFFNGDDSLGFGLVPTGFFQEGSQWSWASSPIAQYWVDVDDSLHLEDSYPLTTLVFGELVWEARWPPPWAITGSRSYQFAENGPQYYGSMVRCIAD